jgi:hypothetical protein
MEPQHADTAYFFRPVHIRNLLGLRDSLQTRRAELH